VDTDNFTRWQTLTLCLTACMVMQCSSAAVNNYAAARGAVGWKTWRPSRNKSCGAILNTDGGVPAAAHTLSNVNKSSSMKTGSSLA